MNTKLPTVAVTGVTGVVGGLVARGLAGAGIGQRLLARTPEKAPVLPGAMALPCDYADQGLCARSLRGVQTLFMVSARETADRLDEHGSFVDAAVAAGVRHIVYTSFMGAAPDATFTLARDHYATEAFIKASGMAYTILRDCFYTDFVGSLVGEDGVIRGPAGDGRVAMVTRADVARVAVRVLREPNRHINETFTLTGPQSLTLTEVAGIVSAASGREVKFHNESVPEAYESRTRWPAPQWQYDAWVSTYTAIAAGELAALSGDVQRITGHRPESLAQFLAATVAEARA
ncbi:SDR family oxidoreductase [Specibacter cremeus]|uniref:SDR family oxidoreductase n=1 Tax=Specibacter cremeus TaxID=1629051 RepID=UPI000F78A9C2|nr:SDR family oxidoreductase [Specibacter cremeus]